MRLQTFVVVLPLLVAAFLLANSANATVYNVSNNSGLSSALASVNPGDSIVMANGNYSGFTATRSGTAANPILIQAANQGQATVNSGIISLSSVGWVTVQGLNVTTTGGSYSADSTSVLVLLGMNRATNCRLTRCIFDPPTNTLPKNTFFSYLSGTCLSNRIDHCEFGWYTNSGCHSVRTSGNVTISGITPPSDRTPWAFGYGPYNPNMARYTWIDHNYFHDHHTPASNGGETIQLGAIGDTGDYQNIYSVVEYNLFVNCDGDPEIISVKSSANTIRYNTVRTSSAVFSLRAGNGDTVYGNYFMCNGSGGGIKSSEHDHKIYDNYIENSDTSNYPLMFESGNLYNAGFSHAQAIRVQVAHNTIVNPGRQVLFEHSGVLPAVDCAFANNIITGSGTLYSEDVTSVNMTRSQNIIFGYTPSQSGFLVENPLLTATDPEKLSASSPAINAGDTNYFSYVTEDMDGQPRSVPRDIGADEYDTTDFIARAPLTNGDVGPNAVDIELSAQPSAQTVSPGATNVSFTINVSADSGFTSTITLTATGMQPGMTAGFNPATISGSGAVTLNVTNTASLLDGTYPLTVNATGSNFTSTIIVTLQVGRSPANLRWTSTSANSWKTQDTAIWFNISSNALDQFLNGDNVLFDDTPGVQTNITVSSGIVSPSIVTNNSSTNYFTISGSGQISGATQIVKLGSSTLTLNTTNEFSGGIVVAGGTLMAGNPYALGGQGGFVIVTNGATLDVNGNNLGMDTILVSGAGVSNNGAIVNNGAAAIPALALVELAGNTTIGGTGRWDLRSSGGTTGQPGTASLSTSGNSFNLTKVGTNFVGIVSVTVDPALAGINIQGGTLDFEGNTTCMGNPAGTLTVYTNATLYFYDDTYGTNLSKVVVLNDGATIQNGGGANTFLGPITLNGNDTFSIGGTSLTLSNKLTGSGNLIKTGSATLNLFGTNSCTGNTIVSNGTLAVAASGIISKNSQIAIASGATFSIAGTVIAGSGGIAAINSGGSLSVSGTLISTNGTIGTLAAPIATMSLNNATVQFSVLAGTTNASVGTLSLSGSSNVINIASLPSNAAAEYPLIKYASLSGGFNFTLGALPGGSIGYLSNNVANGSVDLVITPSSFSVSATPPSQTAASGGATVNYTVTLATNSSFTGSVTFALSGLPANTSFTFTPPSLSAAGNSTLSVTTSNSTPVGTYPLTISGFNSNATNSTGVTLIVGRTGGANLEWNSTASTAWDVTNSFNWFNFGTGVNDQFYNGDSVTFDDSATVTTITIGTGIAVMPSAITNISSANNFTISGAGTISGATGIVKDGTSTLKLATTNSFTGGVTILNGTVQVGCTNALGATGSSVTIYDGGTLDLNGNNLTAAAVTVGGSGVNGAGALVNSGSQQTAAFRNVTLSDNVTFGGTNRWDIRNSGGTPSLNMTPGGSGFSITKVGTNQVSLVGVTTIDSTLGDIDIQQGTLAIQTSTTQLGDATRTATVHTGATLDFYTLSTSFNKNIVMQDGAIIFNEKGPSYMAGTVDLQGTAIFDVANSGTPPILNCSNTITDAGNLVLTGGGILALSGTNTYTGSTIITNGTLMLTNNGSISNSALINITTPGILAVAGGGTFTLNSGQTLVGNGTINGNLNVSTNATISPGNSGNVGILTVTGSVSLGGTIAMKLNKTLQTNDVIASSGASLNYAGGTLMLTNLSGTLAATDSFKLFSASSYGVSGSLLNISPAIPALNLAWNTNTLTTDGTLRIVSAPTPPPQFSSAIANGNNIILNGTNGPAGYPFIILTSTNVALPLAQWTAVATNNFDSNGNFAFTNSASTTSQLFFLLKLQ